MQPSAWPKSDLTNPERSTVPYPPRKYPSRRANVPGTDERNAQVPGTYQCPQRRGLEGLKGLRSILAATWEWLLKFSAHASRRHCF